MAYFIYNILVMALFILAIPYFVYRLFKEEGFFERLRQSFLFYHQKDILKVQNCEAIWIHAASVGEIVATSAVIKELKKVMPDKKILLSVVTVTGYKMAKRIIQEADSIIFFPLDLPFLPSTIIKKIKPALFVNVETELWPNFLRAIQKNKIKALMINGRISAKSRRHYQYLFVILKNMLSVIEHFCMQSSLDAENIIALGADVKKVTVTGNTKYDQNYTLITSEKKEEWKVLFGWQKKKIIVAGSTYEGEELVLLKVLKQINLKIKDVVLLLAPRSVLRAKEINTLAKENGFRTACRSFLKEKDSLSLNDGFEVIILDTIGELGEIYSIAEIVFVAGSFLRQGGHNILEPAAHGKPIITGPYMQNFQDIYELFKKEKACLTVECESELEEIMLNLLEDSQKAQEIGNKAFQIVEKSRGASLRNVEFIKKCLENKLG